MKKIFTFCVSLLAALSVFAYDFQSGDLFYNITSSSAPYTVEVTYEEYFSFDNYSGLTTATIPASVFYNGITYSVTSIGNGAFEYCDSLTSITIPNSVTSIGNSAFSSCSSLTSITIPNSVTSIGKNVFDYCNKLSTMVVEEGNTKYDSRENCNAIIEAATNTLIAGCPYTRIPSSVKSIGERAFWGCRSLTSITIPNSVTSIGGNAFSDCYSLDTIHVAATTPPALEDSTVFMGTPSPVCVIPCGTLAAYEASDWVSQVDRFVEECPIPTVVKAKVPASWENDDITVWVWTDGAGTEYPTTKEGDWYVYTHTDDTEFNIIFKSGTGWKGNTYQTVDIDGITANTCLEIQPTNIKAIYTIVDCPSIIYELNGGVTNDYDWMSKDDMYHELLVDINAIMPTTKVDVDTVTLAYDKTKNIQEGIPTYWGSLDSLFTNFDFLSKWSWLINYMDSTCVLESKLLPSTFSTSLRFNLSAFFIEKERTAWPTTPDYSKYGLYSYYQPAWQHGFANPTNPMGDFILNAPYREGYTFAGWYTTPDFSGEKVTTINAETTGTLYAKWINNDWIITYTSTDGNIVTPYATDVFGANIVSNTYENGVGTITFDGPVTTIGDWAFAECTSLASITLPNSVTSIGQWAFEYCFSLTSITIPKSVTSIGDYAFEYCSSLTSMTVENGNTVYDSRENCNAIIETATNTLIAGCQNTIIPNSVTSIGDDAFIGCSGLTSITIPNSVTSIGEWAFAECTSLASITLPNSVTSIGDEAFAYCSSLTSITIPNSVTSIGDGVFMSCSSLSSIAIPNTVTSIGGSAFSHCSSFTSITIPNSVTSIGSFAFEDCFSLTSMTVENGNTVYDSRENCNAIIETATNTLIAVCQNTIIPNSVTSIGDWAFSNCSSLTSITIPNSVTSIGFGAFCLCSSLTSITIPNSVTSIGEMAFWYCYSLDTIHVEATTPPALEDSTVFKDTPSPVCVIPCGTLAAYEASDWASQVGSFEEDCVEGQQIYYTSTDGNIVTPYKTDVFGANIVSNTYENGVGTITFDGPVTSIGDYAFYNCSSLTSIEIPNSVTSIGRWAFSGCDSLISIVVEDGNATYDSRTNCNAIIETATNTLIAGCQNTIIPNSVTSIGRRAFSGCSSLTSITIPNSVTSIGDDAFGLCSSLTNIAIPNSVTSIEDGAFYDCTSLASVTVGNSVTSIGILAFWGCSSLTSITLPNSVTSIGDQAFYWCYSLDTIHIEAITPPTLGTEAVTSSPTCYIPCETLSAYQASDWASQVSEFVEEGCIPVQQCGDDLFWEYADGVLTIIGTGDMYDYADDKTGPAPWYDVRGSITTINMPNEMTKIGDYAFYKCTEVTSINMPTTLTAIGEKAFAQDTKLACEIILPASMTTIASRAFFNCQAVNAFHIEATTPPTIANDAFERTTAPIHVPCGYGHIYGKHTQWGMLNLEMCELLHDNVYYYPIDGHTARAVTYHSNPTDTIVIPSAVVIDGMPRTVTEVADFAFTDCANLPAISFNEGLEYIGERAFVRCYGLQGTIVLPATLETIGERAFSYCDNVEKYLIQAMTPPALGDGAFTCANHDALFYVSCEVMDDYKVAARWSSLKSRLRDACLNIYHYNTALGANGVHTTEDTLVASIYYRRQFTPYRWETLYLPFEVDRVTVLEDGVEYDLTAWDIVDGGHYFLAKPDGMLNKEILFGFTDELASHTPYIIQFSDAYYTDKLITFYGKESWNKLSTSFEVLSSSAWMQIAGNTTMQDQLLEKPVYMLRSGLDFILQKTTTTLHPFECYVMPYATPSGTPARMNVRFRGDVPTAVESVKGNESHLTYTVDGYTLTVYPQGQAFSIYSLNGALIYSCEAGKEAVDCELNSGCYLLHAGAEAHKIML